MRKILLFLDGQVAKHYLETVLSVYSSSNDYIVVYMDETLPPETKPDNFLFYKFDPTSLSKLTKVLKADVSESHILLKNKVDTTATYENIRSVRANMKITMYDHWGLNIEDKNCVILDANKILSARMTHELPNIPVTAQNIGLGIGELMEVSIPFSSSYVYRTIGSIEQKNWKIAALYRNNKIIIARDHLVIQPNDTLLIMGEPTVLKNVYQAIKRELGQFPMPFGNNIYLYLNMARMKTYEIDHAIREAEYLHAQLKNKRLVIRIVYPNDFEMLEKIKGMEYNLVSVYVDYDGKETAKLLKQDIRQFSVGLIILPHMMFRERAFRKELYRTGIPVYKTGYTPSEEAMESIVFLSDKKETEKISSVVFDFSSQLDMRITLYDYDPEGIKKVEVIEHYEYLSRIFSRNINVITTDHENPIRAVNRRKNMVQILPFTQEILLGRYFWVASINIEQLYFKLNRFPQLFVPVTSI